ncbi:MAG TPA: hypothetical protein VID93_06675, partial [Acidimicrobiales bacterium]
MSAEAARRVVAEVTGELSGWAHRRELSGTRPDPAEELEHSELLIALALERLSRDRLAVGQEPLDPAEASSVTEEVRAVLFGFGPLDRLLLDPTIENVHANGCDRVFIARAGGERVTGPPLAATDAEL